MIRVKRDSKRERERERDREAGRTGSGGRATSAGGRKFHAVVAEHVEQFVSQRRDVVLDLGHVVLRHTLVIVTPPWATS